MRRLAISCYASQRGHGRWPQYPNERPNFAHQDSDTTGLMQRGKSGAIRITSSVRPSRESGTVMPSAFAVFKLTTNWILVACYTGRSAGFSPFKMRPV